MRVMTKINYLRSISIPFIITEILLKHFQIETNHINSRSKLKRVNSGNTRAIARNLIKND
jgi:hypothetical protein